MSPHAPRAVLRLLPDERLARLAAAGSEPAFDALYTRHAAGLTASCRRILRDDEDAHDAVQSTMLKAWAALDRRGGSPLRPWLYRIAHNESVSLLRRRRPVAELPESAVASTDVHATATDRADLAGAISGIGALPPRQREALLMRVLGNSSYDDIAATLDTSPAAARQSVTSARRTLRRRVAGILPLPAWLAELSAIANSGTSMLSGQVAGRAAATVTAAVATVGVVHGPVDRQAQTARAAVRAPTARVAAAPVTHKAIVTPTVVAAAAPAPAKVTVTAAQPATRSVSPARKTTSSRSKPAPASTQQRPQTDDDQWDQRHDDELDPPIDDEQPSTDDMPAGGPMLRGAPGRSAATQTDGPGIATFSGPSDHGDGSGGMTDPPTDDGDPAPPAP